MTPKSGNANRERATPIDAVRGGQNDALARGGLVAYGHEGSGAKRNGRQDIVRLEGCVPLMPGSRPSTYVVLPHPKLSAKSNTVRAAATLWRICFVLCMLLPCAYCRQ